MAQEPKESKEEILRTHIEKYYYHKGRNLSKDDILPVSRILPAMDAYAQQKVSELQSTHSKDIGELVQALKDCHAAVPNDGTWNYQSAMAQAFSLIQKHSSNT